MTKRIINLSDVIEKRKASQSVVDEYVLSELTRRRLKIVRNLRSSKNPFVQMELMDKREQYEYTWRDVVFYLVVVQRVRIEQLIPTLRERSDEDERYFVKCCERRRRFRRAND